MLGGGGVGVGLSGRGYKAVKIVDYSHQAAFSIPSWASMYVKRGTNDAGPFAQPCYTLLQAMRAQRPPSS